MKRKYSAYKDDVLVSRGTFDDLELLELDFPSEEYLVVLDEFHDFPERKADYAELRRMAYPPLSDFADATYWQSQGDSSKMEAYLAKIEQVKLLYPKPSN